MPRIVALKFAVLAAITACAHAQAVIEGSVALPGTKTAPVVTKRYELVSKAGVLAISPSVAVVWIEGNFPKPTTQPAAQMAQKDLAFVTPLLVVQTGTKVEFPNLDDTYHNIFSYSKTKRFDLGRYRPEERPIPSQIFDKPGPVTLYCDIHEHMRGLILVVDSPHFATTDTAGKFRLPGLPAGKYTLKAWLDTKTIIERPVEVKSGETLRLQLP